MMPIATLALRSLALATLLLTQSSVLAADQRATSNAAMARAPGSLTLQTLATVGGQPDDITVDPHGRLVWGDIARGTVYRLDGHRIVTLARGISVPEGIIALGHGILIVAEQGRDRIVRFGSHGREAVLYTLQPVSGQDGVDGIGLDPRTGKLLIPDSPRGTLLETDVSGRLARILATGLGRPVDAAAETNGTILVPDEHLGTLVTISPQGRVTYQGSFSTPDDVAIDRQGRIWVTSLGDGGLWLLARGEQPRRILVGLADPQGLTLDRCGDPIVVEQNTALIVRVLLTPRAARCPI